MTEEKIVVNFTVYSYITVVWNTIMYMKTAMIIANISSNHYWLAMVNCFSPETWWWTWCLRAQCNIHPAGCIFDMLIVCFVYITNERFSLPKYKLTEKNRKGGGWDNFQWCRESFISIYFYLKLCFLIQKALLVSKWSCSKQHSVWLMFYELLFWD